jgi:choline kinase
MDVLILAAGVGSRLQLDTPKCLIEVGGKSLLQHQLDALDAHGAERVTLVLGYQQDRVRAAAADRAHVLTSDCFERTNSLYSFWLARRAIEGDVLVMNSDVLFDPEILSDLLAVEGSALAYDSTSGTDEEHMKVRARRGRLLRMSKNMAPMYAHGENLGLVHLSAPAARAAFSAADRLVRQGRTNEWVGAAFTEIAAQHRISCCDVAGQPWIEIDSMEDLQWARNNTWPAIENRIVRAPNVIRLTEPAPAEAAR